MNSYHTQEGTYIKQIEKIAAKVGILEGSLKDNTKIGTFRRKYLDIRSHCLSIGIDERKMRHLDIAFEAFESRGAKFSKKYLRRFIRRVCLGQEE